MQYIEVLSTRAIVALEPAHVAQQRAELRTVDPHGLPRL
jgi:hypothetical protein